MSPEYFIIAGLIVIFGDLDKEALLN